MNARAIERGGLGAQSCDAFLEFACAAREERRGVVADVVEIDVFKVQKAQKLGISRPRLSESRVRAL